MVSLPSVSALTPGRITNAVSLRLQ